MSVYVLAQFVNSINSQHWNWCLFCLQITESLALKKDVIHVKFGTRTQTTIS